MKLSNHEWKIVRAAVTSMRNGKAEKMVFGKPYSKEYRSLQTQCRVLNEIIRKMDETVLIREANL